MASFRDLNDIELDRLSDEELIDQVRAARRVGAADGEKLARRVLVFRHHRDVEGRARLKANREVAAEIADRVILDALEMEHRGESLGEFRSLLRTLLQRRLADHYRAKRLETVPLDDLDGERGGASAGVEGRVVASVLVDVALRDLSAVHRRVVIRFVLDGDQAREVAELVNREYGSELETPMSEANVHKIASRFRARLREELEGGSGL